MNHQSTFITGATGFLGHYIVAELLQRSQSCTCFIRPGKWSILQNLLEDLGIDVPKCIKDELLQFIEGELPDSLPQDVPHPISRVIHVAGSTRFDSDGSGNPDKTNNQGTKQLLDWMTDRQIYELHAISTAYVCGSSNGVSYEKLISHDATFRNEYEHSKWMSESHVQSWAHAQETSVTIYRPSIIVGSYETGRATKFVGPYLACRAVDLTNKNAKKNRSFRIEGDANSPLDIVPVDYVASFIAEVVMRDCLHGQIYHLTHPDPPSHGLFRDVASQHLGIQMMEFVSKDSVEVKEFNRVERSFRNLTSSIRPYMVDATVFDRTNTKAVENVTGVSCPSWDNLSLHRLVGYGNQVRWLEGVQSQTNTKVWSTYFESFLPERLRQSEIAKMESLNVTVCFILTDLPDGKWYCKFTHGALDQVVRGDCSLVEDFTFQTTTSAFEEIVSNRCEPQAAFLDGDIDIFGNIEQAMKMGEILRRFIQEHPYANDDEGVKKYD